LVEKTLKMLATKNFWILLFHETNFSVGPDSAVKLHFTSKITFCPWIQFTELHSACGFFAHNCILAMDPMHRITFCSCILHPELHSGHYFNAQNYILNSRRRITFWIQCPELNFAHGFNAQCTPILNLNRKNHGIMLPGRFV